MTNIPKLVQCLREMHQKYGSFKRIEWLTGLTIECLENIAHQKRMAHRTSTLNILYDYFKIPKDEFYYKNVKTFHRDHSSVLGTFFREKRLRLWHTISEVERGTKLSARTILRLEAGDSLPAHGGYTIMKLIEFYKLSEEEAQCVRWYIAILTDMISCINNLVSSK